MQNYTEECLITLAEECAEVIQVVSKIQRFGATSFHPETGVSNLDKLNQEIGDMLTMVDLLVNEGLLDKLKIQNAKIYKRAKFAKFSIHKPAPKPIPD